MDGLTIGLAFGLAAAGGVGGFLLSNFGNLLGGVANAFMRSDVIKETSPVRDGVIGAFMGAALGLAIGSGIDYLSGDEGSKAIPIEEFDTDIRNKLSECADLAEKAGKTEFTLEQGRNGTYTCKLEM